MIISMLTCAHFPGWCFTAGVQYPTAIGSIRPIEPFPFPGLLCCLRCINQNDYVALRSMIVFHE